MGEKGCALKNRSQIASTRGMARAKRSPKPFMTDNDK